MLLQALISLLIFCLLVIIIAERDLLKYPSIMDNSDPNDGFVYFSFQFHYFLIHVFSCTLFRSTHIQDCFLFLVNRFFSSFCNVIFNPGNIPCSDVCVTLPKVFMFYNIGLYFLAYEIKTEPWLL